MSQCETLVFSKEQFVICCVGISRMQINNLQNNGQPIKATLLNALMSEKTAPTRSQWLNVTFNYSSTFLQLKLGQSAAVTWLLTCLLIFVPLRSTVQCVSYCFSSSRSLQRKEAKVGFSRYENNLRLITIALWYDA